MIRLLALLFSFIIANTSTALAAKARSIDSNSDSEFHAKHLALHIGESSCHATGNYIKTRSQSNKDKIIGHLEKADSFRLIDVTDDYVLIQVIDAHNSSPDSWAGMTGWVDSDYIDCPCSYNEYMNHSNPTLNNTISSKIEDYIGTSAIVCTGSNLRVRNKPNGKTILGHLEKADEFILLDVQNGWAQITVIKAASTSPDSWNGLSGWVSAEYIRVKANASVPTNHNDFWDGYSDILNYFYQAIIEEWDTQKIVDSGFLEPYYFPNSLDQYGFVLEDLNSDGIKELIILHKDYFSGNRDTFITAIYTRANGQPVRILESWTRNRHYVCSDGSVYNEGSNGASYSVYYILELIGPKFIVREGVLSGDYEEHGKTKYGWFLVDERADFSYAEHTLISDEEAEQKIALYKCKIIHRFDNFTTFAEYEDTLFYNSLN